MLEAFGFIGRQVIYRAIGTMNHRASQCPDVQSFFKRCSFNNGRSSVEQTTNVSSHDGEMAHDSSRRPIANLITISLRWVTGKSREHLPTIGPNNAARLGIPILSCSAAILKPGLLGMYEKPCFTIVLTDPPPEDPSANLIIGKRKESASISRNICKLIRSGPKRQYSWDQSETQGQKVTSVGLTHALFMNCSIRMPSSNRVVISCKEDLPTVHQAVTLMNQISCRPKNVMPPSNHREGIRSYLAGYSRAESPQPHPSSPRLSSR